MIKGESGEGFLEGSTVKNSQNEVDSDSESKLKAQRSSDPSYNKSNSSPKIRVGSAPVGNSNNTNPLMTVRKKGPLLKLSGNHRFRKWKWRMCYVSKQRFSFHPLNKPKAPIVDIDLNDVDLFTLRNDDPKIHKLRKFKSKIDIQWDEVRILYFNPIKQGKVKYFAVNKDQFDEWIMSIAFAKQEIDSNQDNITNERKNTNESVNNNVNDESNTKQDINNDQGSQIVTQETINEPTSDDQTSVRFKDEQIQTQDETPTEVVSNEIEEINSFEEIGSTKETPFSETSVHNDTAPTHRKYTLVALKKTNILDFKFDEGEP